MRRLALSDSGSVVAPAYTDIKPYLQDSSSLHRVLDIFEVYDEISGSRMNLTKSRVLRSCGYSGTVRIILECPDITIVGITCTTEVVASSNWISVERDIQLSVERASGYPLPYAQRRHLARQHCQRSHLQRAFSFGCGLFFYGSSRKVSPARPALVQPRELGGMELYMCN